MAKQLNQSSATVNMVFTADASQAKAQIVSLQKDLQNLMTTSLSSSGVERGLSGYSTDIAKLQSVLKSSVDEFGKLDLSKFQKGLSSSGMSINSLQTSLMGMGSAGSAAFNKLATSIMQAEMPIRQTNKLITEMKTTLANTARWTVASAAVKGLQSGISEAYQYAQNLNRSLTDIRIVSEKSADEMARFAVEANKAAKELNTTTKNYADASLIYYQQGLSDQAVKQRTDITVKMANVAGESAETVSSQLTAVWNNFDDGSKSLEYFADVMVKLGAYTASSTDEISAGLQKFAPIAKTVGLSYEYAASAIATITAVTRESADVVGTSLKTIFSRIQGLKLGETLEDGTDLNKYSVALQSIGIDIKDANGNLKDMDLILDEMGAKWESLTRAEKMATAETVGGTRQYVQLMNLMENWDYFKELVDVSNNSTGTLDTQAQIYAESWKAATDQVKASLEGLWGTLIDSDFWIDMTNGLANLIQIVDHFAEALGGLGPILALVAASMVRTFGPEISKGINNIVDRVKDVTGITEKEQAATKIEAAKALEKQGEKSGSEQAKAGYNAQSAHMQRVINEGKDWSPEARNTVNSLIDQEGSINNDLLASSKRVQTADRNASRVNMAIERSQVDEAKKELNNQKKRIREAAKDRDLVQEGQRLSDSDYADLAKQIHTEGLSYRPYTDAVGRAQKTQEKLKSTRLSAEGQNKLAAIATSYGDLGSTGDIANLKQLQEYAKDLAIDLKDIPENAKLGNLTDGYKDLQKALEQISSASEEAGANVDDLKKSLTGALDKITSQGTNAADLAANYAKELENAGFDEDTVKRAQKAFNDVLNEQREAYGERSSNVQRREAAGNAVEQAMERANVKEDLSIGDSLGAIAQGAAGAVQAVISLKGAIDLCQSSEASFGEKLIGTLGLVASGAEGANEALQQLSKGFLGEEMELTDILSGDFLEKIWNGVSRDGTGLIGAWKKSSSIMDAFGLDRNQVTPEVISQMAQAMRDSGESAQTFREALQGVVPDDVIRNLDLSETGFEALKTSLSSTTAVIWAQVKAWIALHSTALWVVAAIAVAVAVIIGINAAIENANSSMQRALETSQEKLSDLTAAYEDATAAVEEFKSAASNYQDCIDEIAELTRGTDEYTQAVLRANEAAEQLLDNNPNIKYSIGSDGLINIDEDSIDEAESELINNQKNAQSAMYAQRAQVQEDTFNANIEKVVSKIMEQDGVNSGTYGMWTNARLTETLSKIYTNDNFNNDVLQDADIFRNWLTDQGFDVGGTTWESLIGDMTAKGEGLTNPWYSVPRELANLTAQALALPGEQADNYVLTATSRFGDEMYGGTKAAKGIPEEIKTAYAKTVGEEFVQAMSEVKLPQDFEDKVVKQYAKERGYDDNQIKTLKDENGNTEYQFYRNGKLTDETWSRASIEADYKANEAQNNFDQDFDIDTFWRRQIMASIGDKLDQIKFMSSAREAFGVLTNDEIDTSTLQTYADLFQNLGADKLKELTQSTGLAGDKLEKFLDYMSSGEWGSVTDLTNRIEELGGAAEPAAEVLLTLINAIRKIFKLGEDEETPTVTETSAIEQYAGVKNISEKITEDSRNLDATDYENLISYAGDEISSFFTRLADGTYQMTGDLEEFQDISNAAAESSYWERGQQLADERLLGVSMVTGWRNRGETYDSFEDFTSDARSGPDQAEKAVDQYNFLNSIGALSEEEQKTLNPAQENFDAWDDLAEKTRGYEDEWNNLLNSLSGNNQELIDNFSALGASQESVYDLNEMLGQAMEAGMLGAAEATEVYNQALDAVISKEAQDWGIEPDDVDTLAQSFKKLYDGAKSGQNTLKLSDQQLKELALDSLKTGKAIEDLRENSDEYLDSAEKLEKTEGWNMKDVKNVKALDKSLSQLVNVPLKKFTKGMRDQITQSKYYDKAIKGDQQALRRLQLEFNRSEEGMQNLCNTMGMAMDNENFTNAVNNVLDEVDALYSQLEEGATMGDLDYSNLESDLNDLISQCGTDRDAINEILNDLQVTARLEPIYETEQVPLNTLNPEVYSQGVELKEGPEGGTKPWYTVSLDSPANITTTMGSVQKLVGYKVEEGSASLDGGSTASSGGGGGGGGGGGQAKTPKAHKKSDMSKRYHRTTERIADTDRKKEAAAEKKERGYGKEKIIQAETEIKLQKQKIELQKEYVEEAAKYLAEDRKTLEDFAASVQDITGMKLEFDNSGVITNFREMEQALLDYENHLIDLENAGMEGPWLELEQRRVDDMREYIERYEETLNLYEEQLQEMFNQADELDQLYLELTDIKVVLQVDVAEDKLTFMEYLLGKIEDNAYKVADAMGYLGQKTAAAMDKIVAYREGIDEIMRRRMDVADDNKLMEAFYNGTISASDLVGLGFTQDDIDKIREYRDGLIEAMEALNEMRTEALDKLTNSFDSFNEQLEGQTAILESHVSVLEAYKDIVDLIGTHNILYGRQILAQLNGAQLGAAKTQLSESKNVYDTLLAQRDEYKRALEDAVISGNEEAARLWRERLADINDTVNSAKDNYLSNFQDALDTAVDIFSDSVELAVEDFDKLLSPLYNTIDALQDAYDRQETVDNDYVQDYEKYYALQKSLRTLDEAIDDTDSIAAKNRLLKIQQEINNYKAEDVKLSQYDLDALEKRIELEKARIALEEGEDAKSTVALTRDDEGNWGYVYTADEEAIREKEQEYEDKLKEYQDLNKEYIDDLQSQIIDFEAETRDAIKNIWEDTTLTEQEKLAQVQQIYETAQQHMADLNQQMNNALANQAGTYELAIDRYKAGNMTLIDSFEETRLSMLTGFKSTDEVMQSFSTALESYIVQLKQLQKDYDKNIDDITKAADVQDWAKTITTEIENIGTESKEASANITQLSKDMTTSFSAGVKAAEEFEKQYSQSIDHMVTENERFIASLTNMIALLSKINTANPEFKDLQDEYDEETAKLRDHQITEAEWDSWYKDWSKRMDKWLNTFDTSGSYTEVDDIALTEQTGAVTPETAILSTEDRDMLNSILNSGTLMMSQGVGALDAAAAIAQSNETIVQQTVEITAEFPNVSDSDEITEALNNLINDASQYANRKDENF